MTKQKDTQPNLEDNAPEGVALSESDQVEARQEGAKEAVKEAAKNSYTYLTDGNLPGDAPKFQYHGKSDIQQFASILDLGPDEFADRIDDKADNPVPEEKVAGLLELERSGQNRTPYVKALCKRLGVDSPYEVTSAGPAYTNDMTPVTKL